MKASAETIAAAERLGIALSEGSTRLPQALGAVQAFEEFGLRPDSVSGCPRHAVFAAGWKVSERRALRCADRQYGMRVDAACRLDCEIRICRLETRRGER